MTSFDKFHLQKIIGTNRSNDNKYIKIELPLVDCNGKAEKYFAFVELGKTLQDEIYRVFHEDSRGQCVLATSVIEGKNRTYIQKIEFNGTEFQNIQVYPILENSREYGLPYVIVNGKAYFPGADELKISQDLVRIGIQDDTQYGTQDLPDYIRFHGGGCCPLTEQKSLELKLDRWNTITELELSAYNANNLLNNLNFDTNFDIFDVNFDTNFNIAKEEPPLSFIHELSALSIYRSQYDNDERESYSTDSTEGIPAVTINSTRLRRARKGNGIILTEAAVNATMQANLTTLMSDTDVIEAINKGEIGIKPFDKIIDKKNKTGPKGFSTEPRKGKPPPPVFLFGVDTDLDLVVLSSTSVFLWGGPPKPFFFLKRKGYGFEPSTYGYPRCFLGSISNSARRTLETRNQRSKTQNPKSKIQNPKCGTESSDLARFGKIANEPLFAGSIKVRRSGQAELQALNKGTKDTSKGYNTTEINKKGNNSYNAFDILKTLKQKKEAGKKIKKKTEEKTEIAFLSPHEKAHRNTATHWTIATIPVISFSTAFQNHHLPVKYQIA
ncbi:MAG: hypothetical protein AB1391_01600 [Candidatus Micrarchaeota archaeon]